MALDLLAKDRYKLAYDQATAVLTTQRTDLTSFQTRAQATLSAAAVATTVIGSIAKAGLFGAAGTTDLLTDKEIVGFAVLFVLTVCASLYCLWPRAGWAFQLSPPELVAAYDQADVAVANDAYVYRNAALSAYAIANGNVRKLNRMAWDVRAAQLVLAAQVVYFLAVVAA
jgi:hypothetical protein